MAGLPARDAGGRWLRRPGGLCLRRAPVAARPPFYSTAASPSPGAAAAGGRPVPLRKKMKEEAKARRAAAAAGGDSGTTTAEHLRGQAVPGWELTVGIEIHAQLNTARKMFSGAAAEEGAEEDEANRHVAFFDAALPGAQPVFQAATVVPAVRAALALGCRVARVSRFDRKHYFHWDQPAGYQITQHYAPLAAGGAVDVYARDGLAAADGPHVRVAVERVQMEQDTAKTVAQPGGARWLDLNRAGRALVEIVSAPQLRHPASAAAFVRKVQQLLRAADACTAGMEAGGLRADVNVSVRRAGESALGVRTEIKNLNSLRAVEDAVVAERNRQIAVLEAGGTVVSETRGWTPGTAGGGGTTHRLRRKEGAVDYRYMPDPDLGPVVVDAALVRHLQQTLGAAPDAELDDLVARYGLAPVDAAALTQLDGGGRAQYYYDVVAAVEARLGADPDPGRVEDARALRAWVANWVLHQLGRLTSERNAAGAADLGMTPEGRCRVPVACLADILAFRHQGRITAGVAKELLYAVFRGDVGGAAGPGGRPTVEAAIEQDGLWFDEIGADEYRRLAEAALAGEDQTLRRFAQPDKPFPQGKLQFLVGKLLRLGPPGRTDPQHAEAAVRAAIGRHVAGEQVNR